ncbi:hypothetical protein IEQ34_021012 [Dendrobium chrysotoxum]|uniref:Uncharacterized protein n=1 Tax=Dendrobium chrysotoxum TaxID=161865 RepID=A0AAV7G3J9_DENCH|nr:hypothetical protein IEQ34_021012 [Dendrobium chrysotoxum]
MELEKVSGEGHVTRDWDRFENCQALFSVDFVETLVDTLVDVDCSKQNPNRVEFDLSWVLNFLQRGGGGDCGGDVWLIHGDLAAMGHMAEWWQDARRDTQGPWKLRNGGEMLGKGRESSREVMEVGGRSRWVAKVGGVVIGMQRSRGRGLGPRSWAPKLRPLIQVIASRPDFNQNWPPHVIISTAALHLGSMADPWEAVGSTKGASEGESGRYWAQLQRPEVEKKTLTWQLEWLKRAFLYINCNVADFVNHN